MVTTIQQIVMHAWSPPQNHPTLKFSTPMARCSGVKCNREGISSAIPVLLHFRTTVTRSHGKNRELWWRIRDPHPNITLPSFFQLNLMFYQPGVFSQSIPTLCVWLNFPLRYGETGWNTATQQQTWLKNYKLQIRQAHTPSSFPLFMIFIPARGWFITIHPRP